MSGLLGLHFLAFKHGQELVLAEFEKGVAFTFVQLFEIENVLIKRHRFLNVAHFDRNVVAAVNLYRHEGRCSRKMEITSDRRFLANQW
jgi:hypothetical protein